MSTTTVYHDTTDERAEFERRRHCSRCGRRLIYSQHDSQWPVEFPARDIRGHLTHGLRAIVDARARSTRIHDL